jgi:hypothetical protein
MDFLSPSILLFKDAPELFHVRLLHKHSRKLTADAKPSAAKRQNTGARRTLTCWTAFKPQSSNPGSMGYNLRPWNFKGGPVGGLALTIEPRQRTLGSSARSRSYRYAAVIKH